LNHKASRLLGTVQMVIETISKLQIFRGVKILLRKVNFFKKYLNYYTNTLNNKHRHRMYSAYT